MQLDIIYNEDCLKGMKKLPDNSVDLVATDPPYGISFMGRAWDRAIPPADVWREAIRILKPGAFAFVMCIPRQDCLARMVVGLEDAGFNVGFSPIFHTFASGFPKAQNVSLTIDKKECRNQLIKKLGRKPTREEFDEAWENFRKFTGRYKTRHGGGIGKSEKIQQLNPDWKETKITAPATPQAQALDGSYSYNPKPAVEIVIVAQKPKTAKTYVDQALLWHEERQEVLRGLATKLKRCYNIGNVEWEDMS